MSKARKSVHPEIIAEMADRGEDVSRFFTNNGTLNPPLSMKTRIQRVNVDFTSPMLKELDDQASALNISRQAVIKTMLREALDRRLLAAAQRRKGAEAGA